MRTTEDPQIFETAKCSIGERCGKAWEVWCRGCCLVFCSTHIVRAVHDCPSRDKKSQVTASRFYPSKSDPAQERGGFTAEPGPRGPDATVTVRILPHNGLPVKEKNNGTHLA